MVHAGAAEGASAYEPLSRLRMEGRCVIMQCGMHPYIQGHGLAVDNPYYVVMGDEGMFDISDLPAGTYRIKVSYPTLGEQERELTVAVGESSSVEFTFKDN